MLFDEYVTINHQINREQRDMLGIIGGTGLTSLPSLKIVKRKIERTPYGEPSQPLIFGEIGGKEVVFLARHGGGHTIPPHAVNYRANIWALKDVGVTDIVAVATVGAIDHGVNVADIVLPNQIIDYTHGRKNTYYDGIEMPVKHIDFTHPYSAELRSQCLQAAKTIHEPLIDGGVYACVQGPRLETAAEIKRIGIDGGTLVGMTGMPEAALARELEIAYAAICPVANDAAGKGESANGIQVEQVMAGLEKTMQRVEGLIAQVAKQVA